jgi:UDP-glucose 4-epimerase
MAWNLHQRICWISGRRVRSHRASITLPDVGDEPPRRGLVVGGGLIGCHIACELVRSGWAVTLLSRTVSPWLGRMPEAARIRLVLREIAHFDPSSSESAELDSLVGASDTVFMVAGRSTPALSDRHAVGSIIESLVPTLTLLESLRRTERSRIVIATSGGTVYGRVAKTPTDESHPTKPISVHGVNSLAIESYASFFARAYELSPTILRCSNVYGPGQRQRGSFAVIAAWMSAALTGSVAQMIGDGHVQRDFIHASDVARAAVLAGPGTFNVGSGDATSLSDLHRAIEDVAGRPLRIERIPGRAVDVPKTCLDTSKLRAQTGWMPETSLESGLRLTWSWLVSDQAR